MNVNRSGGVEKHRLLFVYVAFVDVVDQRGEPSWLLRRR
jgi:hypothetical protein